MLCGILPQTLQDQGSLAGNRFRSALILAQKFLRNLDER